MHEFPAAQGGSHFLPPNETDALIATAKTFQNHEEPTVRTEVKSALPFLKNEEPVNQLFTSLRSLLWVGFNCYSIDVHDAASVVPDRFHGAG